MSNDTTNEPSETAESVKVRQIVDGRGIHGVGEYYCCPGAGGGLDWTGQQIVERSDNRAGEKRSEVKQKKQQKETADAEGKKHVVSDVIGGHGVGDRTL